MKVKMTTNFKTNKYGFLKNTSIYDLDVDDAKNFIKRARAIQLDLDLTIAEVKKENEVAIKEVVCSKEELKLNGLREAKVKLRKKTTLKRNMIKANAKNEGEKKSLLKSEVEPMNAEIAILDEKIKRTEEKLKK